MGQNEQPDRYPDNEQQAGEDQRQRNFKMVRASLFINDPQKYADQPRNQRCQEEKLYHPALQNLHHMGRKQPFQEMAGLRIDTGEGLAGIATDGIE